VILQAAVLAYFLGVCYMHCAPAGPESAGFLSAARGDIELNMAT
jgi:hypothetical protein